MELEQIKQVGADLLDSLNYPSFEDVYVALDAEEISDEIVDTRRWSTTHEAILKIDGKFYQFYYSAPATEEQEYDRYEMADDWNGIYEVEPVEVTVTKYVRV